MDEAFTNIQFNTNNNSSSSSSNTANNNGQQQQQQIDNQRPSYTIPGILHYLQHEWSRFEYDRQQWEADRAELLSKISFLQGERRGQENLKNDLIRRIKMLELALKQERVKYYKLKNGCDPKSQEDLLKPQQQQHQPNDQQNEQTTESDLNYTNILNQHSNSNGIKNGRQLLKQYLQEIGYTDTIIDIRSTRLRTLLTNQAINSKSSNNGEDEGKKLLKSINDQQQHQQQLLLNTNNNNNNMIVDIDLNEDDDESNELNVTAISRAFNNVKLQQNGGDSSSSESSSYDDSETEDALKEFSFLTNENSTTTSSGELNDDWNVNKEQLNKLTEQYKKDRKNKTIKGGGSIQQQQQQQNETNLFQRPNRSILQAMIANLNDNNNSNQYDNDKSSSSSLIEPQQQQQQKITFNLDDTSLNLGELSRISVNNNDDTIIIDQHHHSSLTDAQHQQQPDDILQNVTQESKRALTIKTNLKGHYDSIRCLSFHPTESLLLTGSEDSTVKLWCLDKSVNNLSSSLNASKKSLTSGGSNSSGDIEPLYTFRGHTGAILSLVVTQNGHQFLTSSQDCTIRMWNMPNDDSDPYDAYEQNIFIRSILGHTDCVWNLCLNESTLVSASSDSTIRIWSNPFNDDVNSIISSNVLNSDRENGIPTSVNFIKNDTNKIICSFDSLKHVLYDIEYCKTISKFDYEIPEKTSFCYKVISNGSNNTIISAHEDKRIRFYDLNSNNLVYSMVAHQDAVTDLDIDSNNMYLLSASHDCSIRLWNLDNKNCIQEITAHRKKYDESIHCIGFHRTRTYIASGGSDGIAKVYV